MEQYNIDKIAAPSYAERSEASTMGGERPAARGALRPDELQGSGEDPRGVGAPQSGAERQTGREASLPGGPGVRTPGGESSDVGERHAARGLQAPDELRGSGGFPREEWKEFEERNRILEDEWGLVPVTSPQEYFRVLFTRGGVNYMQETGQPYWGDHHYNAIAYDLRPYESKDKKTGATVTKYRANKYDITRALDECVFLTTPEAHRVISAPVLYAGRSRRAKMGRSIWGIAIDLDDVRKHNLADIAWWIRHLDRTPMPSMIVSSGNGLHLYYLFPMGVGTKNARLLHRLKQNITQFMWNGLFSSDPNPDLHQGIWQGFRIPGTPTKRDGYKVVGFVPEEIPYYTVRELNTWFQPDMEGTIDRESRPLTEKEIEAIEEDRYLPSKTSFQEAKLKWPGWVPGASGQWVSNRKLYDWWLRLIRKRDKAIVAGRRYYWVLSLVAFAKKCQIPYEELEQDAYSLLEQMEALTVKEDNHFTASDIEDALRSYRYTGERSLARYKKNYIGAKTGYIFKETRRNGRSREENLMIARAARDVDMKSRGVDRWQGTGRSKMRKAKLAVEMWCGRHPYSCNKSQCAEECTYDGYELYRDDKGVQHRRRVTKHLEAHAVARWWWHENPNTPAEAVLKWRTDHPGNENKSLCARECGVTRPTVIKWWNCTSEDAEAVREEKRARQQALTMMAVESREGTGATGTEEQQEPHGLGAAANAGYITDKRIAGHAMAQVPGEHGEEETSETRYDLADAINDSEISVENIMKLLGFPENLIPIMKPQIEAAMSSPEFWEQYRKANPNVQWPPELEAAYQRVIRAHKDKSTS